MARAEAKLGGEWAMKPMEMKMIERLIHTALWEGLGWVRGVG